MKKWILSIFALLFFFNVQAKEINDKEFKVLKAPLD